MSKKLPLHLLTTSYNQHPLCPLAIAVLAACMAVGATRTTLADTVVKWNEVMAGVVQTDPQYENPGMTSRTMAMVNLAIYDAVNGISGQRPTFYSHNVSPGASASIEAAAAAAAHGVLASLYPSQQSFLDAELATSLSSIADINARTAGQTFGSSIASSVVAHRANDGFDEMVQYTPHGGPGHWSPDPLNPSQQAWGPGWGSLQPFALQNPSAHLPPPMPELTSDEYAASFNEVKELGALNSTTRTQEQTDIGFFWAYDRVGMGSPLRMYNQILCNISTNQGNTLEENAELFALAAVAMADAGVVAWDAKFEYDLWRPVTGIRDAEHDGNPDTIDDDDWTPLGAPGGGVVNDFTPPFPTYVSGHATFGGALFETIANFYGTDAISFDVTSDEMPGMVRSYTSVYDAMAENGRSRVYLGIHWDFDDIQGQLTGMGIADAIFANGLVAVPEPSSIAACLLLVSLGVAVRAARR